MHCIHCIHCKHYIHCTHCTHCLHCIHYFHYIHCARCIHCIHCIHYMHYIRCAVYTVYTAYIVYTIYTAYTAHCMRCIHCIHCIHCTLCTLYTLTHSHTLTLSPLTPVCLCAAVCEFHLLVWHANDCCFAVLRGVLGCGSRRMCLSLSASFFVIVIAVIAGRPSAGTGIAEYDEERTAPYR